jgi:hypothetical protein
MSAIKVNADYESVLFFNKPLPVVNEALEFFAMYLESRPIITSKIYSKEFLDHVESFTGKRPVLQKEGKSENWWGPLTNLELEKKLNSKEMSAAFNDDSFVLKSLADLPKLDKTYLAKNPFGMSGQNFAMVEEGRLENLEVMLKKGPVVIEPFFDRKFDFSHYVFSNGVSICYENLVDKRFQYRGTIFKDYTQPTLQNLSFFDKVDWKHFHSDFEKIKALYKSELKSGYSVDSFVYEDNGLKVRSLSEVNYRRTMGQTAFELSMKFGGVRKWSALLMTKSRHDFLDTKKKLLPLEWEPDTSRGVIILTPGDVRYDMFFLSALNETEGKILLNEMRELLPDCEFPVEL